MSLNSCFCFLLILFYFVASVNSYVTQCTTCFEYYKNLFSISANCYHNPDGGATPEQILERWGYNVEKYNLVTEDGYNFTVLRTYKNITSSTPIIMGHGIYLNCRSFLSLEKKSSVSRLVESGHQIFLINNRGTIYSTGNINGLTQSNYTYWNFSVNHLGIYEVRQTVAFVYNMTNQQSLFIGYSMGTTAAFIYVSSYPNEAAVYLKGIICLAPVAHFSHPIPSLLAIFSPFWPYIQPIAKAVFNGKILPRNEGFLNWCARGCFEMFICYLPLAFIYGPDFGLNYTCRPVGVINNPDAVGEFIVTHYSQMINSHKFQNFDYGPDENKVIYGTATPPQYPVANIKVKVTLICGEGDWLATCKNAEALWQIISPDVRCIFIRLNYTHDDFITKCSSTLAEIVLQVVAEMEIESCKYTTTLL